ncbi:MAG: CAMK/CAMKL/KIN1 protein kinase [Amphiamblys sp. WSBS2006]|nr:MAG: CAMK/CAMKL/KIN1 protein kinase [Amphiamblys sp. WSBS2006]
MEKFGGMAAEESDKVATDVVLSRDGELDGEEDVTVGGSAVHGVIVRGRYSGQEACIRYIVKGEEKRVNRISLKSVGMYRVIKTLGSGSTGKVSLAQDLSTGKRVALKVVPRLWDSTGKEAVEKRERRIFKEAALVHVLRHPNIVYFREMYVTRKMFCMVFEYVDGTPMIDLVLRGGKQSETRARGYFREILSAVEYIHAHSIVHWDLKIENIMVDSQGTVRLLDFGLSSLYCEDEHLRTFCGSLYFAAPELLSGRSYVGPEIDVWSLGVILFVLACGKVPFDDCSVSKLRSKIKRGQFCIPKGVSNECRDLLKRMLDADRTTRIELGGVIDHPWTCREHSGPIARTPVQPEDSFSNSVVSLVEREFGVSRAGVSPQTSTGSFSEKPFKSLCTLVKRGKEQTACPEEKETATQQTPLPRLSRGSLYSLASSHPRKDAPESLLVCRKRVVLILRRMGTLFVEEGGKFVCEYVPSIEIYETRCYREIEENSIVKFELALVRDRARKYQIQPRKLSGPTHIYNLLCIQIENFFSSIDQSFF